MNQLYECIYLNFIYWINFWEFLMQQKLHIVHVNADR